MNRILRTELATANSGVRRCRICKEILSIPLILSKNRKRNPVNPFLILFILLESLFLSLAGSATFAQQLNPLPFLRLSAELAKPRAAITALAFSADGKTLAVGTYGQVALYDTKNWQVSKVFSQVADTARALAFHPDGKTLAIGSGLPGRTGDILFWDTTGTEKPKLFPPQKDTIEAIAFQKNGKCMLVGGNDSKAHYYPNLPYGFGPTMDEHNGRVQAVAFSSKEKYIFITGAMDRVVKVWDARTNKTVVNFDQSQGGITGLVFLPNGDQFIGSSLDGQLYWWGVNYEEKKHLFSGYHYRTQMAHPDGILALGISGDGQRIITGGMDKAVAIWKADDGGQQFVFREPQKPIYAVALNPDGKLAAAGGQEGILRLWDVEGNKLLATLIPPELPKPVNTLKSTISAKTTTK